MEILYYAIPTVIIAYLVFQLGVLPFLIKKKMVELFKNLDKYEYREVKKDLYHYVLENDEIMYLINVCKIPSNSTVTINSKDTWSLTWGGNPKNKGRAYRHQNYLKELSSFLRKDYDYSKKYIKLIILYPDTEKILRYLNESDLDVVEAKDSPYGYKVTTYNKFLKDFKIFEGGNTNEKTLS